MRTVKILLILLLSSLSFSRTLAQEKQLPPLINRELFFGDPEISGGQISPDGKFLSFIKPYKDVRNIWVKKSDEDFSSAKPLTADSLRPIRGYFWSRDGKYILYSQDKGGDENFNIYAVNPNDPEAPGNEIPVNRDLTNLKGVRVYIYYVPYTDPDAIYIGLNDRDNAWHDLYKLKISTGEKTLIRQNSETDRITGWVFDWDDKPRLATRANADGSNDILRVDDKKLVAVYSTGPYENAIPIVFDKTNKLFYLSTNKGDQQNFSRLVAFDPVSLTEKLVDKDPLNRVDFAGLVVSEVTREIFYTAYEDDKIRLYWKDKKFEAEYNMLKKQLSGQELQYTSTSTDENLWLFVAVSDTNPGAGYLYNRLTGKFTLQYRSRPKIPTNDLSPMAVVRYPSSDGLEIPAYLTLPKGIDPKNLPVIVLPHGGPWGRDAWTYSSYAQFLANRGYAVLMPNFRGSTGYGKNFLNAGNNQWGQKMQDDITWGVKYLVSRGIGDPKRIGIMGGSYGGYATLAGVAFTPDLYAAAISIVGPSNLITLLNSIPPYWESIRKMFHLRMGDPTTPEGKEQLIRQSPLTHAKNIKTPLMIVQGANDPRVNKAESDQIVVALRDRGFPVEYIMAPDEGHGFVRPINNMAMLAAAEKFLAKFLGGRYQESMTPEVEQRLAQITVNVKDVILKLTPAK